MPAMATSAASVSGWPPRGVALVASNHLRKSTGKAIYRSMGSLAFAGRPGSSWGGRTADPARRLVVPIRPTWLRVRWPGLYHWGRGRRARGGLGGWPCGRGR